MQGRWNFVWIIYVIITLFGIQIWLEGGLEKKPCCYCNLIDRSYGWLKQSIWQIQAFLTFFRSEQLTCSRNGVHYRLQSTCSGNFCPGRNTQGLGTTAYRLVPQKLLKFYTLILLGWQEVPQNPHRPRKAARFSRHHHLTSGRPCLYFILSLSLYVIALG